MLLDMTEGINSRLGHCSCLPTVPRAFLSEDALLFLLVFLGKLMLQLLIPGYIA